MSASRPAAVVVLAAGEGTRMRSATPKVLHAIGGRSLVGHAIAAARGVDPEFLVVVVRHQRDAVVAHLAEIAPDVRIADQDHIKGTGRATACGLAVVPDVDGTVVVTYGDVPLLTAETLADLVAEHQRGGHAVTLLTSIADDPTGYGRVVRDADGAVVAIVEQKDATPEQLAVREINSGIYAFDGAFLRAALAQVSTDNAAGEAYLTDVVAIARAAGRQVAGLPLDDGWQTEGVNDRVQLAQLGRVLRDRLVEKWMRAGVTVIDPQTTWLDVTVELAPDVTLLPGTQLLGYTNIAEGALIGPDTTLTDCVVGVDASVVRSQGTGATIGAGATVGPFSFLRPGTQLGAAGKIGAYVETKNAVIGKGSKVPHLSYVGDAVIGEGTNIGAATIFVNYDGEAKHHSTVGDHVRIGSDTMLIAPVTIGDGAYTAAGSVIDGDVPPGALAVGRARQRVIDGWVARKRAGSRSAAAAVAAALAAPATALAVVAPAAPADLPEAAADVQAPGSSEPNEGQHR